VGASILSNSPSPPCLAITWIFLVLTCPLASGAELPQGEVVYDADQINSQLRTDSMELIGNVSFVQGKSSITADRARYRASGKDDVQWNFEGSVHVRTIEAELRADKVDANLVKGQLATARAQGSPAEFRQLSGAAESRGEGHAQIIEYEVSTGVVKLTGNVEPVWFVYGKEKNEFRTDVLTYDMRSGTVSTGRTRGTIRLSGKSSAPSDAPPKESGANEPAPDASVNRGDGA
jgi:lipopolysaccharide transport protein LptA